MSTYQNERISDLAPCNASLGQVVHNWPKIIWFCSMLIIAIVGGILTFSYAALGLFVVTTFVSLCLGHSVGMHRKLIHQSYQCPLWLEYILVHFGV